MNLSELDHGPYADDETARRMLVLGVLDPALAAGPAHQRARSEVVIDLALIQCGVDDLTDFERSALHQLAMDVSDPVLGQVVAGWIRRAHQAGALAAIIGSGPVNP